MAKTKPEPEAGATPAKKSRKKLILVVGAALMMGAAGAAGAYFYLHGKEGAAAKPVVAEHKAPVFLQIDPFTVNLTRENGDHYLQLAIVYQVDDEKVADTAKTYMPIMRSRILLLLSSKRPSDLSSVEGKEKLVNELVETARSTLPESSKPERGIEGAHIASLIIQ